MVGASPLAALGLTAVEEAAYRHLIGRPSTALGEVAAALDISTAETGRILGALRDLGLAARAGDRYVATSPAVALPPLVNRRRDALHRAEMELMALAEHYRSAAADRAPGDLVEVVTGAEAVGRRFAQLQAGAVVEVRALVTAATAVVSREANTAEDEGVRRGVRYRVVVERAVLEQHPGAAGDAADAARAGEEIRVADHVPIKLLIADRALGMVPMSAEGGEPAAAVVHRSGLLDALLALFDAVWGRACPLRVAGPLPDGAGLSALDRQVLGLLLAGLTDRSIASQLGLSMRTVQRRVQGLMEAAGVQTRLQLGWHAASAGWA